RWRIQGARDAGGDRSPRFEEPGRSVPRGRVRRPRRGSFRSAIGATRGNGHTQPQTPAAAAQTRQANAGSAGGQLQSALGVRPAGHQTLQARVLSPKVENAAAAGFLIRKGSPPSRRRMPSPISPRRPLAGSALGALLLLAAPGARAEVPPPPQAPQRSELHARGEDLRREGKLLQAGQALQACSRDLECPGVISTECAQMLEQLRPSIPTLVFAAIDAQGRDTADVQVY